MVSIRWYLGSLKGQLESLYLGALLGGWGRPAWSLRAPQAPRPIKRACSFGPFDGDIDRALLERI